MEHRLSCWSSTRPRRSAQRQGTLPNNALHLTTARTQKESAVAGERERYAFVQAGSRSVLRFFTLLIRLLLCLGLALFIDFVVYVCWYRPNDHEWPLGAYILSVIAVVWGSPAFILGYIFRILRDRLIMRSSGPPTAEKIST